MLVSRSRFVLATMAIALMLLGGWPLWSGDVASSTSADTVLLADASHALDEAVVLPRMLVVSGKMTCLACDPAGNPEALDHCERMGHRHGIVMHGHVYEIQPGNPQARKAMYSPDLYGKDVVVSGRFSRSSIALVSGGAGTILASHIEAKR